ncbi:MAG TPA: LuxR C-terminal-related transcriptional regulator [Mycobacterium sp.]|nr:LuxR C-terminal-related transcriptional regulator [Mycobacterium sp.]
MYGRTRAVAARLFISPRTVEPDLTHVYTKLALSSRVQLAREAVRHDPRTGG